MKQNCDLHTHSVFSDGTYTPTEIIEEVVNIGLFAVALCVHNTVDGVKEFLSAAKGKNIKAISGVELSVDYDGTELHLLALNIPENNLYKVSELTEEVNERKRQSNKDLVVALNQSGYEIDYEKIEKTTPNGNFNRAHIAEELTRKGYTEVTKEFVENTKPFAVICATGAYASKPKFIDSYDRENVYTTTEIFDGSVLLENKKVTVIGSGMTVLETAELLTVSGNKDCTGAPCSLC